MEREFYVSTVLSGTHPTQVHTTSGQILSRQDVIESMVRLHQHLAKIYGVSLNHQTVTNGVKSILENPALGHVILAWHRSGNRILGQVEIKRPFEVWYNAGYWYLDNHIVFPNDQEKTVGTALLDYVKNSAKNEGVIRLRLYVGHMNEEAKGYYKNFGFESVGDLFEYRV
jgi:ribosomal protein S18 acetylase RimI-like enzyme